MVNHMKKVEQSGYNHLPGYFEAYCTQALELLPKFKVGKHEILPQIVILDTDQTEQEPRSIIRAIPPGECLNKNYTEAIYEIMTEVVTNFFASGEIPTTVLPGDITSALLEVRLRLQEKNIRHEELKALFKLREHSIKGSVLWKHRETLSKSLPNGFDGAQGDGLCYCVEKNYICQTKFDPTGMREAFMAILQEAAYTTWNLENNEINEQVVSNIALLMLPFSSLGVLRGCAVWFLLGHANEIAEICGDKGEEMNGRLRPALARDISLILSEIFSSAALDSFTAYFTGHLSELTVLNPERTRELGKRAFCSLYPSIDVFFSNKDTPSKTNNLLHMDFKYRQIQEFFGAEGIVWEIIAPAQSRSVPPIRQNLIELRILDIAISAAKEVEREHGRILRTYGHQIGTLMKTSGMLWLRNQLVMEREYTDNQVRLVLENMLSVWGLTRSLSLVKRFGAPRFWRDSIDEAALFDESMARKVEEAVLDIIRYFYLNPKETKPPFFQWTIHWSEGIEALKPDDPRMGQAALPKSLQPFIDEPQMHDLTLAWTMGLVEVLRNMRKYPDREEDDNFLTDREYMK